MTGHRPARVEVGFDREGARYWRCEGVEDLRQPRAAGRDTRFRWFSVTKLFTATRVMQLVDDGRLSLTAPLPSARGASIEALLSHASGLPNPSALGWVHPPGVPLRSPETLTEELLRRHPSSSEPQEVRYSNLGFLLLGREIERVVGAPYREQIRRALLEPLRMHASGFDVEPAAVGHESLLSLRAPVMALLFARRTPGLVRYLRGPWIGLSSFAIEGDAYGGLLGPLEDLVRFGQMHLNDGVLDGRRVLSAAGAREMRRPRNDDFALGFERFPDGWLGHDGQAGGYRASFRLHPERGEGYASLAATGDGR